MGIGAITSTSFITTENNKKLFLTQRINKSKATINKTEFYYLNFLTLFRILLFSSILLLFQFALYFYCNGFFIYINCLLRLQYFIITVLRNLIIIGALSQSLSYVLLRKPVQFLSCLAAPVRTTLYRL